MAILTISQILENIKNAALEQNEETPLFIMDKATIDRNEVTNMVRYILPYKLLRINMGEPSNLDNHITDHFELLLIDQIIPNAQDSNILLFVVNNFEEQRLVFTIIPINPSKNTLMYH